MNDLENRVIEIERLIEELKKWVTVIADRELMIAQHMIEMNKDMYSLASTLARLETLDRQPMFHVKQFKDMQ